MIMGTNTRVAGSTEAVLLSSVCRSGYRTGWRCGIIEAKNQTVLVNGSYDIQVLGLTRTSACAEPGDSGGPFISGDQAQGMTSMGSGNCTSGGTSYFQPVKRVLRDLGVALVTGP
jgi:streptogrisin C